VNAPKMSLPGHRESYRPPLEYTADASALGKYDRQVARAKKEGTLYLGGTFKGGQGLLKEDEAPEMVKLRKFLPRQYEALRHAVGSYPFLLNDRFARCLDLYLCPRVLKNKLHMDPDDLLPKLPDLKDLRPYPNKVAALLGPHSHVDGSHGPSVAVIQSVVFEPHRGQWLLAGEKNGRVSLYDVLRGQALQSWRLSDTGDRSSLPVGHAETPSDPNTDRAGSASDESTDLSFSSPTLVSWNPNPDLAMLVMARGGDVYLETCKFAPKEKRERTNDILSKAYLAHLEKEESSEHDDRSRLHRRETAGNSLAGRWTLNKETPCYTLRIATGNMMLTSFGWHRKGDYFVTTARQMSRALLHVHQLSAGRRQSPLTKIDAGLVKAAFHPSKPALVILSRNKLVLFDLSSKIHGTAASPSALRSLEIKLATDVAIHPSGEHIVLSSLASQLQWYDLETSATQVSAVPTRSLSFHQDGTAVRQVVFHSRLPLMASCGDDATLRITHTHVPHSHSPDDKEWTDMTLKAPMIVPVKRLQAPQLQRPLPKISHQGSGPESSKNEMSKSLLALAFHPLLPWVVSAGETQLPFLSIATHY
jgi:ribosome biogenesis protein ERB1